jgi:hypothetical protein
VSRPFAAEQRARDEDLDRKEPRFSATKNGFDVHCASRPATTSAASASSGIARAHPSRSNASSG